MFAQKITFIIVEYNTVDKLSSFVTLINDSTQGYLCEIIVVCNTLFTLEEQGELQTQHPEVIFCFNSKNYGYAKAINIGFEKAEGDIIVVANLNCIIKDINPNLIFHAFENDSSLGIIGPEIKDSNGIVQESFRDFMTIKTFLKRQLNRFVFNKKIQFEPHEGHKVVDWIIGAFIITKRDVFVKLQGFDSKYFMYVEDLDFCKRAHKKGYKTIYDPRLKIEYNASRRSVSNFNKYTFIHIKSVLRFFTKSFKLIF